MVNEEENGVNGEKKTVDDELPESVAKRIKDGNFTDTQIDYIKKIPWKKKECPEIDVGYAQQILDQTHYGMHTIKQQIMRYIVCQKHLGRAYGDVLLLVGPPGVGKTSIARSVAKAMKRPFIKIPLAGVNNAGPLRGYDSNYQDPKPGLIVDGIIEAKSLCPLILLDEIDKMGGSDSHGYPEHVLLHMLDGDRSEFIDDMIQIPIDLSNIVFLATANSRKEISPILLNRLETIELSGYSLEEKIKIAKDYIIPELTRELAIQDFDLKISPELIRYVVELHILEPGIRSIRRSLKVMFETVIMEWYVNRIKPEEITVTEFKRIMNQGGKTNRNRRTKVVKHDVNDEFNY